MISTVRTLGCFVPGPLAQRGIAADHGGEPLSPGALGCSSFIYSCVYYDFPFRTTDVSHLLIKMLISFNIFSVHGTLKR